MYSPFLLSKCVFVASLLTVMGRVFHYVQYTVYKDSWMIRYFSIYTSTTYLSEFAIMSSSILCAI